MRAGIIHQGCVDTVVTYIQQHRLKDIILVGHSFGGSVIQKVVQEILFIDVCITLCGSHTRSLFITLPAEATARLFSADRSRAYQKTGPHRHNEDW